MQLKDDVCEFCELKKECSPLKDILCAPLTWIDGDKPRKENLLHDISDIDVYPWRNPNTAIAELIEHRENALENIKFIRDMRIRLIAAGLLSDIPKCKIAELMHLSERRIQQLTCHK